MSVAMRPLGEIDDLFGWNPVPVDRGVDEPDAPLVEPVAVLLGAAEAGDHDQVGLLG